MTTYEKRRYEMLQRVREFGGAHRDLFPENSPGRQALDEVGEVVRQLGEQAVAKMSATRGGTGSKALARQALKARLDVVNRTARLIAAGTPGFDEQFRLPPRRSDQDLVTTGRMFIGNVEAAKSRFLEYGLPEPFIAGLIALVDEFEQAIRGREAAKDGQASARATIEAALSAGVAAARRLDIVLATQSVDAATMVVWERDRRVDYARRGRKGVTPEAGPGPAPLESGAGPLRVAS